MVPQLRWGDVLVGITIYLKTSIDFAIFIGRLMQKYQGWKNRIMIEIGTALGNITGTLVILVLWDIFREVKFLMAIMIVIAAPEVYA
jgi:cadmium resistance protein CadD (predicted permease)